MRLPYPYRDVRKARGDALLESLICVLIMAIIGAGSTYIASRMNVSARQTRANGAATTQMRVLLQQYGATLCPGAASHSRAAVILPGSYAHQSLDVKCTEGMKVSVGGVSIDQPSSVVLCVPKDSAGQFEGTIKVGNNAKVTCG